MRPSRSSIDTGLVHRDLKPANIFVRDDGHPVLVDLGIAARFGGARGREELFADTKVMGSAFYMAPEQFGGEAFDARADLYSLGCILYETVTGRPPFFEPGITPRGILFRILDSEPAPPSRLATWLDPALERLILRLLDRRPRDRVGYAEDVAAALAPFCGPAGDLALPGVQAYVYRPDFTGRTELLGDLGAVLREAVRGRGAAVFVRGESGVGKTRLSWPRSRAAPAGLGCPGRARRVHDPRRARPRGTPMRGRSRRCARSCA